MRGRLVRRVDDRFERRLNFLWGHRHKYCSSIFAIASGPANTASNILCLRMRMSSNNSDCTRITGVHADHLQHGEQRHDHRVSRLAGFEELRHRDRLVRCDQLSRGVGPSSARSKLIRASARTSARSCGARVSAGTSSPGQPAKRPVRLALRRRRTATSPAATRRDLRLAASDKEAARRS